MWESTMRRWSFGLTPFPGMNDFVGNGTMIPDGADEPTEVPRR